MNRNWVPVNVTTVEEAIKQMVVDAVTSINIESDTVCSPTKWEEWMKLPVRDNIDYVVRSQKLTIRAPTVVVASKYSKVHKSTIKFSPKNIKALYKGICQYTGEPAPDGNVDHIVPRGKGGKDTWENVVWSKREINSKKGNRYNHEIGLPEVKGKKPPIHVVPLKIMNNMLPEWKPFIIR